MESVEASGKSIEDAILQALARLGRNRDEVEIIILQEPQRGSRGMSAREARVRVHVKQQRPGRAAVVTPEMADAYLPAELDEGDEYEAAGEYDGEYEDEYGEDEAAAGPVAQVPAVTTDALGDVMPEDATTEEIAVAALYTILAHMDIQAGIDVSPAEGENPLVLNIRGAQPNSLSILIGRRGETLAALQLLMNLMLAKQSGRHERVIVDVEGYRHRREDNLRSMAERIADQVRRSGNPVMLEAMPPNERRIIHMALADYEDITTESEGEGDQRRVVVSMKRGTRR